MPFAAASGGNAGPNAVTLSALMMAGVGGGGGNGVRQDAVGAVEEMCRVLDLDREHFRGSDGGAVAAVEFACASRGLAM